MLKKLYAVLASARLTIFLLFALAASSVFGTLVVQGLPREHYENTFGPALVFFLDLFDITDLYHSWWFVSLLFLLALNIAFCTARTLPGTVKQAFSKNRGIHDVIFDTWPIRYACDTKESFETVKGKVRAAIRRLAGEPIEKTEDGVTYFHAETGAYTRMGTVFVHVSVLAVLAGGLIGSIGGFRGQMTIPEGDVSHTVHLSAGTAEKALPFSVRCNRFFLEFYDNGMPKEYRSDLTIIDEGREVAQESIRVNHPLTYRGFKLCQASYGIADASDFRISLTDKKSGKTEKLTLNLMKKVPLPVNDASFAVARFVPDFQGQGPAVLGVILAPGMPHDIFWIPAGAHPSSGRARGDFIFRLEEFTTRYYTGIQVSQDPGMPLVWLGFALMLAGFILVLFGSHRRIGVRISAARDGSLVEVAATTGKKGDERFAKAVVKDFSKLSI